VLFNELNIVAPILRALDEQGYTKPTPIQAQAIPPVLEGRDLLGCAQTGTGKTAAFAIPILQRLAALKSGPAKPGYVQSLILTPTRELAIQIAENIEAYGRHLNLRHLVIFGGVNQYSQVEGLKKGVDILVATPGRLLDLMSQGYIGLKEVKIFVLDEADRMLDMGFVHDVKRVIVQLPRERQTLFFSATMPNEIQQLAQTILHQPVKVEVTPVSSTAETVAQQLFYVGKNDKKKLLQMLLEDSAIESVLVFTRTKHGANKVVQDLEKAGISAEAIHGNKSQAARQRALSNFKSHQTRVLVATDIAARGIDIDELKHVINYEIPNIPETYVHRIGRTGRAGNTGLALSFCDAEETSYIKDIHKLIGKQIPVQDHPYHTDHPLGVRQAASKPAPPPRNRFSRNTHAGGNARRPQHSGQRHQ
jgi:ATP-dependent RNA helicase RhlE